MCKDDSWFIRHVEPPNACRPSDNLDRYQTRPLLVAKDITTTGWQIACCTEEFRLCQPGRLRPQGVIHVIRTIPACPVCLESGRPKDARAFPASPARMPRGLDS